MSLSCRIFIIIVLNIIFINNIKSQNTPVPENKDSLEAYVRLHYIQNGMAKYGIDMVQYQLYADSVLMYFPKSAYFWQQKAMPLFKWGKYDLGMTYLDKAVALDEEEYLSYRAFIKCIFTKQHRESIADYHLKIAKYGESYEMDHPYYFYMGMDYLQLNQLDSARITLEKCMNYEQKMTQSVHYLTWFYRGIVEYEALNYSLAIEYLQKSLQEYPTFSDAKFYLARSHWALEQPEEAKKLISEALIDINKGYTINETNADYEKYPYQIKKSLVQYLIEKYNQ
ncbi:MAG: tetratricopeptide repeat protein [Leadbetterella sp.]